MNKTAFFILIGIFLCACQSRTKEDKHSRKPVSVRTHQVKESEEFRVGGSLGPVFPIEHASFALQLNHQMIYVDPMGNSTLYSDLPKADLVLITHYHPDYLVPSAVQTLLDENSILLVPEMVKNVLPDHLKKQAEVLGKDKEMDFHEIRIQALTPKYSVEDSTRLSSTYLIRNDRTSVLVVDDFEELMMNKEVRNVDMLLVRMKMENFEQLSAVTEKILQLNPKKVYPYYYDGSFSFSKVAVLKKQIEDKNPDIEVEVLNWYPRKEELVF